VALDPLGADESAERATDRIDLGRAPRAKAPREIALAGAADSAALSSDVVTASPYTRSVICSWPATSASASRSPAAAAPARAPARAGHRHGADRIGSTASVRPARRRTVAS